MAYHPHRRRSAESVEAADAPKVFILYAVIGAVIGIMVLEYGLVVGFVVFGIGGLTRFRTDLPSAPDTGRLILITLVGLSCGLDLPHVAVRGVPNRRRAEELREGAGDVHLPRAARAATRRIGAASRGRSAGEFAWGRRLGRGLRRLPAPPGLRTPAPEGEHCRMPHEDPRPLDPAHLRKPAQHSVRVIASALLEDVLAAHARLEDDDEDALHDLRVAMRRLRSWLRVFRPELSDTVRGGTRRKLKALASATNDARDDEVTLAFIARQTDLPPRTRAAVREIVDRLEEVCAEHSRAMRRSLGSDLRKTTRALTTELESWWERHRLDEAATVRRMSVVYAEAIRDGARKLASALTRIEGADKADDVHRARIAAKRLRYLLEPLGEEHRAMESVQQLRSLQRQLGEARDAHRIATRLVREIGEHAARAARGRALRSAGLVSGEDAEPQQPLGSRSVLTELARRAQLAREAAYREYATHWTTEELAAFGGRIDGIAAGVAEG